MARHKKLLKSHSLLDIHVREARLLPIDIFNQLNVNKDVVYGQCLKWQDKEFHDDVLNKLDAVMQAMQNYIVEQACLKN